MKSVPLDIASTTPIQQLSVASPRSKTDLDRVNKEIGAKTITQINHPNDPVANGWLNEDANYEFRLTPKSLLDIKYYHPFETYYPKVKEKLNGAKDNE